MNQWLQEIASSGSLMLAVPLALAAGLVGFFSPCVLPLLPGYMSYVTGISGAELAAGEGDQQRARMLAGSGLFVLGFGTVFVFFGFTTGTLGAALIEYKRQIQVGSGALVILMGLAFVGMVPALQREFRLNKVPGVGLAFAPILGAIFGLGWMPCMGPTLGAILTLGFMEGTAARGALLAACYTVGLGLPFLALAAAYNRGMRSLTWVKAHQSAIVRAGGVLLVLVGVLLATGWWAWVITWVQVHLNSGWSFSL